MHGRRLFSARRWYAASVLLFAGAIVAPLAHAQQTLRKNEFGIWGAYSANSPDVWGSRGHVQFGEAAFRYGRILATWPSYTVEYTVDIEPVEVTREDHYATCESNSNGLVLVYSCEQGKQVVYGGGLSPFGWKFNLRPAHRWQPFGALSGGFVMSKRAIPKDVPGTTRFNFTFDFQVGIEHVNASHTRAWTFAYKLQHISNAYRSSVNPGVDLNMISVGYSFFK
jgi:Lipid A 3-O-deacylase (PagL)